MNIEEIKNPQFLKQLNINELEDLSQEIRRFIMQSVATTGGHFSSNLGIVELTVAMHYVFDAPRDKIIFDVGHQSYVHKILTGRAKEFRRLRQFGSISGFQRRHESEYDPWEAGHSSTAISGAIGIATARDLNHDDYNVIAVVGDAAMMSGESFEALNYLGSSKHKVIVILNDNNMSISKNVGGFSNMLSDIRTSKQYKDVKDNYTSWMMRSKTGQRVYDATKKVKDKVKERVLADSAFAQFDLDYIGPVNGHDMEELIRALETVKELDHSVILHVITTKGKGYPLAEEDKSGLYHGVGPFDLSKGVIKPHHLHHQMWSEAIANHIEYLMHDHDDICVITPAMIAGSQLGDIFKKFPARSFDVGIAEEHAATFAAGLSVAGKFPFLTVYSSFSQRAYDQINHDIARMDLPCLIGLDRAGLVGSDGSTHHGVFDISYLLAIPNVIIMAPHNQYEAERMINTAYTLHDHPYVIRYSKGMIHKHSRHVTDTLQVGSWDEIVYKKEHKVTVVVYGDHVRMAKNVVEQNNLPVNVINARFIKPMDEEMLKEISNTHIIVYETVMHKGSLGSAMALYYEEHHINVKMDFMAIGDHYVTHGDIPTLLHIENLSPEDLLHKIKEALDEERKS